MRNRVGLYIREASAPRRFRRPHTKNSYALIGGQPFPVPDGVYYLRYKLGAKTQELAQLSPSHVEHSYHEAYADCAFTHNRLPGPRAVQRLLCVWKVLWRWKERSRR
jgi:hypothetical protein